MAQPPGSQDTSLLLQTLLRTMLHELPNMNLANITGPSPLQTTLVQPLVPSAPVNPSSYTQVAPYSSSPTRTESSGPYTPLTSVSSLNSANLNSVNSLMLTAPKNTFQSSFSNLPMVGGSHSHPNRNASHPGDFVHQQFKMPNNRKVNNALASAKKVTQVKAKPFIIGKTSNTVS
jgi:hypothetical protein